MQKLLNPDNRLLFSSAAFQLPTPLDTKVFQNDTNLFPHACTPYELAHDVMRFQTGRMRCQEADIVIRSSWGDFVIELQPLKVDERNSTEQEAALRKYLG